MDKNEINNFLQENKIKIQGGTISNYKQLSLLLNSVARKEFEKEKIDKAMYFIMKIMKCYL